MHISKKEANAGPTGDRVSLTLEAEAGWVARARVDRQRWGGLTALLTGRPAEDAVRLMGLVYALCGTAQRVAAVSAVEAALGVPVPAAVTAARQGLVLVEALDQGLMHVGVDWARQGGAAVDAVPLRLLRQVLMGVRARVAAMVPDWDRLTGASDGAVGVWPPQGLSAEVAVFQENLRTWIGWEEDRLTGLKPLRSWAGQGETVAARGLAQALAVPPVSNADVTGGLLTGWTVDALAARLRDPGAAGAFIARPEWRGAAAETGALARQGTHPLVVSLRADGAGPAARLVARLVDLWGMAEALRVVTLGAGSLGDEALGDEALGEKALGEKALGEGAGALVHPILSAQGDGAGVGVAAVETARGLLVHRVVVSPSVEDGYRVLDWRSLAPTDWNAHPEGVLARAPLGWPANDGPALTRWGALLGLAVDPCVPYDLRLLGVPEGRADHA